MSGLGMLSGTGVLSGTGMLSVLGMRDDLLDPGSAPGWGIGILVGVVLALANVGVAASTIAAARGSLGPNAVMGIRVRPLLDSPEQWQAGHAAARPVVVPACVVGGIAALLTIPAAVAALPYLVAVGVSVVTLLAGALVGTVRAVRAARALAPRS
jgi:hypothetical protein